jgi:hypothetical protein
MSLDFYLKDADDNTLFDANITHNLNKMADAAGIYKVLWRPDEIGIETAAEVIPILREGLCKLVSDPPYYKQFDSPNEWGLYVHFVPFCIEVLEACIAHPEAFVEVSR